MAKCIQPGQRTHAAFFFLVGTELNVAGSIAPVIANCEKAITPFANNQSANVTMKPMG